VPAPPGAARALPAGRAAERSPATQSGRERKVILTGCASSQDSSKVFPLRADMQYYTNQSSKF